MSRYYRFGTDALLTVIKVSAPMLLMGLTVGLIVSIFQTVTSIQESTLAFIPKLLQFLCLFYFILDAYHLMIYNNLYTNKNMYIRKGKLIMDFLDE